MTRSIFCLLPDLNGGGAERVMMYLLAGLDRDRYRPTLGVGRLRGPYVPLVPRDVEVLEFGTESGRASVAAVARELRRTAFDLCFSMVSMNLAAVAARTLARARLPLVLSARNHYSRSLPSEARFARVKMAAVRLLYPRAELVTCVSQGVADDLARNFGVRADRIRVIHNPIDLERVRRLGEEELRDPWFAPDATVPVLVAVGKLQTAKGYPNLLEAFREVRAVMSARLLILGDGPERERIEGIIDRTRLREDVRLVGFDANPYRYLRRATLFVHAALWEGFPNVLVEAMAVGAPVVSTDCPSGPGEIITSGVNGILVPVADPSLQALAILDLLRDPLRRQALAREASHRVTAFDSPAVIERYSAVFDEAVTTMTQS